MSSAAAIFAEARILIVDDNKINVELLVSILTHAGYRQITSTTDPREVRGLQEAAPFDIILLDIRMPHLDGFQVMAQLAELAADDYLPVLVLTAHSDAETRRRALTVGAKDFITKPVDRTELLSRVANMLEVRRLYNERRRQAETLETMVHERTLALEERNRQLERTRLEVIRRLARAGEYRDNETGFHVLRMSRSCQRLALAAGLGERVAELIRHASQMHDVGKIGIPDHILLKPGRLDAAEMATMKRHTEIGARIFEDTDDELLAMARVIALTHHERWDGAGYPAGLRGEDIPIEGRICAVCDVFDALTSERPYKKAWTVEEAIAHLRDNAGQHFDPELVQHFVEILPEILEIRDRYRDPEHPVLGAAAE
jgi:putative two-component system response regulator